MVGKKCVHGITDPQTGPSLLTVPWAEAFSKPGDICLGNGPSNWHPHVALRKHSQNRWVPMTPEEVVIFVEKAAPSHWADFSLYSSDDGNWYVAAQKWGDKGHEFFSGPTPGLAVLEAISVLKRGDDDMWLG